MLQPWPASAGLWPQLGWNACGIQVRDRDVPRRTSLRRFAAVAPSKDGRAAAPKTDAARR